MFFTKCFVFLETQSGYHEPLAAVALLLAGMFRANRFYISS